MQPNGVVAFDPQHPGSGTATAVLLDRPTGYGGTPQLQVWTLPDGTRVGFSPKPYILNPKF